jgi:hypothetical protein
MKYLFGNGNGEAGTWYKLKQPGAKADSGLPILVPIATIV